MAIWIPKVDITSLISLIMLSIRMIAIDKVLNNQNKNSHNMNVLSTRSRYSYTNIQTIQRRMALHLLKLISFHFVCFSFYAGAGCSFRKLVPLKQFLTFLFHFFVLDVCVEINIWKENDQSEQKLWTSSTWSGMEWNNCKQNDNQMKHFEEPMNFVFRFNYATKKYTNFTFKFDLILLQLFWTFFRQKQLLSLLIIANVQNWFS